MKLLTFLALLSLTLKADIDYKYQSTSLQASNFSYRLSSPNTEDTVYDTQTYEVKHTDILAIGNLQLTSQIEASKRYNNYLNREYFNDSYIYFKALYLEYYFSETYSLYGGVVPYTYDFLNVYAHKQVGIGEGLSLINGGIKTTLGVTYKSKGLKLRIGYVPTTKTLGEGPYSDIPIPDDWDVKAFTAGGTYKYKQHKFELDSYTADIKTKLNRYGLSDLAVSYVYDDIEDSGIAYSLQYAISKAKDPIQSRSGNAYNIAIKVDSDILPSIYAFKYGAEYIKTSRYFKTASRVIVNNRSNTFYKGSMVTVFMDFYIKKNYGFAIGYNQSQYDYITTQNFTETYPIDVQVKALYTSFFYHF